MPLLLQIIMFTAPIGYSSNSIPQNIKDICYLNPLAILIEAFRQTVVHGINPNMNQMIYCAIGSTIFLGLAYVLFKRWDTTPSRRDLNMPLIDISVVQALQDGLVSVDFVCPVLTMQRGYTEPTLQSKAEASSLHIGGVVRELSPARSSVVTSISSIVAA